MVRTKRQPIINHNSHRNTKKLRILTTIDTNIETLSNEIFLEIFDYLDGYDICNAFSNLNNRFQQLLNSTSLRLKIAFDYDSNIDTKKLCKDVVIPHRHHITSLHILTSQYIEEFFNYCVIDSSFNHLASIDLYGITKQTLIATLFYLKSLPRLSILTIETDEYDSSSFNLKEIYRMIFCLSSLKYHSFHVSDEREEEDIPLPLSINQRFSTIECLIMTHECTFNELIWIFHHTPQLRRMRCYTLVKSDNGIENEMTITMSNLVSIHIVRCQIKFEKLKNFIQKIRSPLHILHINWFMNENFVHPDQWKRLILDNLPQLQSFQLKSYANFNDTSSDIYFDSFVHQFTSQFWIDRGLVFGLEIEPEKILYSIYSTKKTAFIIDKNSDIITGYSKQNVYYIGNSNQEESSSTCMPFARPIELCIRRDFTSEWNISSVNKLSSVLMTVRFTSLSIHFSEIPVSILIKLISLLPNLNSLKLLYSSLTQMDSLSIDDVKNLRTISMSNKITKVSHSWKSKLTNFCINLCPRMKYLEMTGGTHATLEESARFILSKIYLHICYLDSLCFHMYAANDEMVDDLRKIIDTEKLLFDYTIERKYNDIFLQWKRRRIY